MAIEKMNVNLNKMTLNSITAFFNINGKFSSGEKDCYFLRCIGYDEERKYVETLTTSEKLFARNIPLRKGGYLRTDRLPFVPSPQEIAKYNQALGRMESSCQTVETLGIGFSFEDPFLNHNQVKAFCHVLDVFRRIAPHSSESIIKNFSIKLLFWMDIYFPKLFLRGFTPAATPKFVFFGPIKLQEYLFLYLLTQVGCDVLYLSTEGDIDLPEGCKALSQVCRGARFGKIQIPAFSEDALKEAPKPIAAANPSKPQGQPFPIPPRPAAPARPARQPMAAANGELTYEELAMRAASVVMIEVADRKGNCFKSGSGVMIGRNGYILTNCHVISEGASFLIRIETEERTYQTSQVIKYNNQFDLAVLQIDRICNPIPICQNQKLTRGQKVVAIGSPLGLFNTVSDGIISAFRSVRDVPMIQFTAPISSGSSGGAVLNMYGELIGLSTAGFDDGQNLNLAVDYHTITSFAGGLIR